MLLPAQSIAVAHAVPCSPEPVQLLGRWFGPVEGGERSLVELGRVLGLPKGEEVYILLGGLQLPRREVQPVSGVCEVVADRLPCSAEDRRGDVGEGRRSHARDRMRPP